MPAADLLRRDAIARQQFFQQHARAGATFAVHEAQPGPQQVGQARDVAGVAGRHHQPLRAAGKADQLVLARLQQRLVSLLGERADTGNVGCVEARHDAAPLVERLDGVHAAGEADVQVQPVAIGAHAAGLTAQGHQRVVVAGVERQHMRAVVEGHCEHALQVGPQRLDLRRQPRLRLALRPQQLVAKGREPRRLAFFPQHQRMPEFLLPALELAPHVPVREAQRLRAGGDGAAAADRLQQAHQRVVDLARAALGIQRVGKTDLVHAASVPDVAKPLPWPGSTYAMKCIAGKA